MFNIELQRTVIAVVGAALLSTTFVGAAVAPAHAVGTAQNAAAEVQLSDEVRA